MKNKRIRDNRIRIAFLPFLFAVLICGCSMKEEIDKRNAEGGNAIKFSEQIVCSQEKGNIDNFVKRQGALMEFKDKLDVADFSWQNETFEEEESETYAGEECSWQGDRGSYIYTERGYIYYAAEEYGYTYAKLLYEGDGSFRTDFYERTKGILSISEMMPEEALNAVHNIIDKYGICTGNEIVYPLNDTVLNGISNEIMSDEEYEESKKEQGGKPTKRNFTKEDEVYLVVMNVMAGEYPLYDSEYWYGRDSYDASVIWALVNKDKIIALYADGVYEIEEKESEISHNFSLNEAKERFVKKYQDIIFWHGAVCDNIEIRYIAVNSDTIGVYDFIPVYVFEVQVPMTYDSSEIKDTDTYTVQKIVFDAEKGTWVE
ncbi:MAG: hypothetical protein K2N34_11425 [Lachnospiraceae bacterium]|nr:hypothetical protein [Lachnospiraceae bacterium]